MLPANITVSLIVVVIAFALFFYMSFKGVNLFLTVFACTFLVCLCTSDGISSIFTASCPLWVRCFSNSCCSIPLAGPLASA